MDKEHQLASRIAKLHFTADLLEKAGRPGCAALIRYAVGMPNLRFSATEHISLRTAWLSEIRRMAKERPSGEKSLPTGEREAQNEALKALVNLARGLTGLLETPENSQDVSQIEQSADAAVRAIDNAGGTTEEKSDEVPCGNAPIFST